MLLMQQNVIYAVILLSAKRVDWIYRLVHAKSKHYEIQIIFWRHFAFFGGINEQL